MRNIIAAITMGLILTGVPVLASPTAEFEQGTLVLEFGSTLQSKVTGQGYMGIGAAGDSGYKYSVTAGLSDKFALQFKDGYCRTEKKTASLAVLGSVRSYAKSEPSDLNLLYKVNPNLVLIAGYEHTTISYGQYIDPASRSMFHVGITGIHKLDDKATLFATMVRGSDASLDEAGISYKLSDTSTFTVSYAERKVKNVDLPIHNLSTLKEDYTMRGITCMLGIKL